VLSGHFGPRSASSLRWRWTRTGLDTTTLRTRHPPSSTCHLCDGCHFMPAEAHIEDGAQERDAGHGGKTAEKLGQRACGSGVGSGAERANRTRGNAARVRSAGSRRHREAASGEPDTAVPREDVMTAAEVAQLLALPKSSVYELARRGELRCARLGRTMRFLRERLRRVCARLPVSWARQVRGHCALAFSRRHQGIRGNWLYSECFFSECNPTAPTGVFHSRVTSTESGCSSLVA
jgi:excisionase family DNA binding protein